MAERDVQKAICQYLSLRRIWYRRMNSGAALVEPGGNGKPRRFIRYGAPGMPDIMARTGAGGIVWIEVKSAKGRQTPDQKQWQEDAERFGDMYIVARKLEDVMEKIPP